MILYVNHNNAKKSISGHNAFFEVEGKYDKSMDGIRFRMGYV